jgi:hypothetical protein
VYLNEYKAFPEATNMPSLGLNNLPTLNKILKDTLPQEIFRCPGDTTYYKKEGMSYEWNIRLNHMPRAKFLDREKNMPLLWGYEAFHGDPDDKGSRNILYLDIHGEGL